MKWPTWWTETRGHAQVTPAGRRIVAELEYLGRLPVADGPSRDEALTEAVSRVAEALSDNGAVAPETRAKIEDSLSPFGAEAKAVTLHCVGHAHLDMNWMWGYDETVVIVVETIRTILRLLEEYPGLRFSQSQASVYRILERFEPDMLSRIQGHVESGRWELAATQWTETDMNLPSGESLLRHGLYTVSYLRRLFGVDRDRLRVVFMPDTFGHSAATPEILAASGVRYLYHGRGSAGPFLSRWIGPAGRGVLAYQDPRWYNETVDPHLFGHAAQLAEELGTRHALSVYGVGDHGGGPTRRDIEALEEMMGWPLAPAIRFSTYHEFFRSIESTPAIPEVRGERNPIFTGCYSSQSAIKAGNRRGERGLFVAEVTASLAGTLIDADRQEARAGMRDAWRDLLFNHFHDILPGSGVTATRHYASALHQEIHARTQVETTRALRRMAEDLAADVAAMVDSLQPPDGGPPSEADRSEGAGVGFGVVADRPAVTGRWGGAVRPYLVVNPLEVEREDVVELTVWDHSERPVRIIGADGQEIPSEVVDAGRHLYWGHTYLTVLVHLRLEPWQRRILFVLPAEATELPAPYHPYGVDNWLVESHPPLVLDNGVLRVGIDSESLAITELSVEGKNLLGPSGARFLFEHEEPGKMTSWLTHRLSRSVPVGPGGRIAGRHTAEGALRQWIEMELPFGVSRLTLRLELDAGARAVRIVAATSFRETFSADDGIPRLVLAVDPAASIDDAVRDIPVGTLPTAADGVPAAAASFFSVRFGDDRLGLVGRDSQSFSADRRTMRAILLRGSGDPDKTPEVGEHEQVLYLGPSIGSRDSWPADAAEARRLLIEPQLLPIERPRTGTRTGTGSGSLDAELAHVRADNLVILSLKPAELEEDAVALRCAAGSDGPGALELGLPNAAREVAVVGACEDEADEGVTATVDGDGFVHVEVPAGRIATILVRVSPPR